MELSNYFSIPVIFETHQILHLKISKCCQSTHCIFLILGLLKHTMSKMSSKIGTRTSCQCQHDWDVSKDFLP
jgi:hypothetical protein